MANPTSQSQPPNPPPPNQPSGFDRFKRGHQGLVDLVTKISAAYPICATYSAASATLSAASKTIYETSVPPERYSSALMNATSYADDAEKCVKAAFYEAAEWRLGYGPLDAAAVETEEKRLREAAKEAAEKHMEAAESVAKIAGGVDLSNVDYEKQVEPLVEDVEYIFRHVGSLESSANSDRAYEFLTDLTDAAATRSVLDFMPDSENLKTLLQTVAKLKLWIPRDKESGDKDTAGPTKKKRSPFVGRQETQKVAAGIVNELFDLKCRQWGMSGLLDAYDHLQDHEKLCLLCFSAFPCEVDKESDPKHGVEKSLEIKNRILIHLWVGEQFIDSSQGGTIEEKGEEILRVLTEKGFIEPVEKKGPRTENGLTGSSRMHPFVHSFVMTLAKRAGFFEFGDGGEITAELGRSERACLLKSRGKYPSSCQLWETWANETDWRWRMTRFQTIQTLFNVDESIIHVNKGWFSNMKHLKVLHLGDWSGRTTKHIEVEDVNEECFSRMKRLETLHLASWRGGTTKHIEVEDQEFLKEVKIMKQMRLLSLQGVSMIQELPDSVTELENLVILDLRECQRLLKLPDGIGSLGNLTHLDLANCHLLTKLPKGIGSLGNLTHLDLTNCHLLTKLPREIRKLSKLKVLKGFVISEDNRDEACTLKDLKEVKELRELSMVVDREHFPTEDEIDVFTEMSELRILRISWEGGFKKEQGNGEEEPRKHKPEVQSRGLRDNNASLEKIEKLQLLCMPYEAPTWLVPDELKGLKKLYIKGGGLKSLPGDPIRTWNVETLRLKYMRELQITWVELREKFPNMKYLESYECDKLEYFPHIRFFSPDQVLEKLPQSVRHMRLDRTGCNKIVQVHVQ